MKRFILWRAICCTAPFTACGARQKPSGLAARTTSEASGDQPTASEFAGGDTRGVLVASGPAQGGPEFIAGSRDHTGRRSSGASLRWPPRSLPREGLRRRLERQNGPNRRGLVCSREPSPGRVSGMASRSLEVVTSGFPRFVGLAALLSPRTPSCGRAASEQLHPGYPRWHQKSYLTPRSRFLQKRGSSSLPNCSRAWKTGGRRLDPSLA
jgi:hypothetical protein